MRKVYRFKALSSWAFVAATGHSPIGVQSAGLSVTQGSFFLSKRQGWETLLPATLLGPPGLWDRGPHTHAVGPGSDHSNGGTGGGCPLQALSSHAPRPVGRGLPRHGRAVRVGDWRPAGAA